MNNILTFFKQLDKLLHILVSYALTLTFALAIPLSYAVGATLLIGVAKEIYDKLHPAAHTADVMDFAADAIGIAAATAVFLLAPTVVAYLKVFFNL